VSRPGGPAATLAELEEWFLRRGLPHLQADYDPREDTLTRLRPALLFLFAAGLAVVLRPDWPWWQRIPAVLVGLAVAAGVLIGLNLMRGRPPLGGDRVGFPEAGVLVLAPALASAVLGDDPGRVALVAAGSLAAAAVVYVLTSLGVVPLLLHQGRPAVEGLVATASVAVRALPPLLAVLLFLSLASETWRAFGRLEGWRFGSVLIGFGLLSGVILVLGLARERRALYTPAPGPELERDARATPARALVEAGVAPASPPLNRIARINVATALMVSLGSRVLAVGVAVGVAFLVFGLLIVDRQLTTEWVGEAPHVLLAVDISGREVIVSEALVRVAGALGGFAALYFVAVALGDARNREEFLDDELDRVRRVMAAWSYYRGALAAPGAPPPGPGTTLP
jgi:hypothetical protein